MKWNTKRMKIILSSMLVLSLFTNCVTTYMILTDAHRPRTDLCFTAVNATAENSQDWKPMMNFSVEVWGVNPEGFFVLLERGHTEGYGYQTANRYETGTLLVVWGYKEAFGHAQRHVPVPFPLPPTGSLSHTQRPLFKLYFYNTTCEMKGGGE